jgi:AAA domain
MAILPFKRPPVFLEDGTICDPHTGEIKNLHGITANQPETNNTVALTPKLTDISAQLYALFPPEFAHQHPEAWIEIAYGHAASGGAITDAQNYTVFELKEAAEFAEARNGIGYNMYVGPALRQGKQPGDGRADDDLVVNASHAWIEFDSAGDAERIDDLLRANNLKPAMIVATGTKPHLRAHLYFKLDGTVTPDKLVTANTSLKALLGSDAVQNASRVMRLGGTINLPTPDKIKRGYAAELTTVRVVKDAPAYRVDALIALAPSATPDDPYAAYADEHGIKPGRTDEELMKLLNSVNGKDGGKEKWRNPMISAVATMVGRRMSDSAIKLVCAPYCDDGIEDPDLQKLIDDQRKDFDKPDPGDTPLARSGKPAPPPTPIRATSYAWKDPATIRRRQWLYGDLLVRKIVSATISPGGVGKSSLVAGEALAMVSGKPLLGVSPPEKLRVWLWNLEDPQEETERKIQAAALHYELGPEDIGDRLLVDSGREQKLVIAKTTRDGAMIVQPVVDSLVAEIIAHGIDVLVIDPFVSCHEVAENDNPAMDMVVKEWGRVADRGNCAVHLVHHTRKMGDATEVTTESSRGGSSQTDACRVVRTVNRMTKVEATNAGIDNPRSYFRTYNDKANFAPPVEKSDWFKLESVDLGNGDMGLPGDSIGVVTEWEWPDVTAGMTAADYDKVVAEVKGGKWKANIQAKENWVGYAIAEALDLDLDVPADKAKVKAALKMYLEAKTLVVVKRQDEDQRRPKNFVEVP